MLTGTRNAAVIILLLLLGDPLAPLDPALAQERTAEEYRAHLDSLEGPIWEQLRDILDRTGGDGCTCVNPFTSDYPPGLVWRGDEPIGLHRIAILAAPIMWFSMDEPLMLSGEGPLPNRHPCDPEPAPTGAVYYAVRSLRLRSAGRKVMTPAQDDPEFLDKVHSFILRYYFYYKRDHGVGEHAHDIEVAEFHLASDRSPDGCYRVRITKVIGMAHGVDWYNNIMEVRRDTRLPISIFVEEGKHASCPDRNGDGVYTPGYDVTKRPNDAWGVRDVLGQGVLQGSAFKAAMSKARDPLTRRLPPADPARCPGLPSRAAASSENLGRYELRAANTIEMCEVEEDPERLHRMMEKHGFGSGHEPEQYEEDVLNDLTSKIEHPASIIPSFSARWDDGVGFSFLLNGLDMSEFWLVPKFNLADRAFGMEIMTTPSASRWNDWYVSLGTDRFPTEKDGDGKVTRDPKWEIAAEVGWKFRFLAPGKIRPFLLGYQFGGARFGIRTNGFDSLRGARFVAELGAGVW